MAVSASTSFWVGPEVEGTPYKGELTLFIRGNQRIEDIQRKADQAKVTHLYFGAGGCSRVIDFTPLKHFLDLDYTVTLELDYLSWSYFRLPQEVYEKCHIILRIKAETVDLLKDSDTIKVETTSRIYCIQKDQTIQNDYAAYEEDTPI